MTLTAGKENFQALNASIRELLLKHDTLELDDVNGQRYIGAALPAGKTILLHGTPGNDMGAYLNGGEIEVFGNGQEATGNTMGGGKIIVHGHVGDTLGYAMRDGEIEVFGNGQEATGNTMGGGKIIVHGHVGDTLGYAMRDGEIFVEKRAGCRAGIHMKEFEAMQPVVVIGGVAGAFLGEYMAGGTLVVLGLDNPEHLPIIGAHCATGMHGGRIFIRGKVPAENVSEHITVTTELDDKDRADLERIVKQYCTLFSASPEAVFSETFTKLIPTTSRPYANLYTPN